MAKSITKNTLYNILLNVSSVIFPLITAPYVSRVLEPDGVGLFNFASTYASYFALVAMLGIPTYGVREVAKVRDDKESLTELVSQLMSIATFSTLGVTFIYLLTVFLVGQLRANYIVFILAGFAIYLAPFKINWYYQGREEFGFITLRTLIIRTLSLLGLFLFVHEKKDLIIYIILCVFGGVLADFWNYVKMWRSGMRPHLTTKGLKPHIQPLMVLFASTVAISVYTVLDTIMLGFIKDYEEVGYYTNAMHLTRILITAVTSLSVVALPRVAYYINKGDYVGFADLTEKSFSFVSFLSFPAAFGLASISSVFVPLFFGSEFMGSVVPTMILSMLIVVIGLNNITGNQILVGAGHDKLFLFSMISGTVSNLIMNSILIPIAGAIGASIASVIAESIVLVSSGILVYKHIPIKPINLKDIIKSFLGSLSFIPLIMALARVFSGWTLVGVFIAAGTCIYFLIEFFLKNSSVDTCLQVMKRKLNRNKL